jgi:general secretion pathway protein G
MDSARIKTTEAQIDQLEGALEFYRMDNANYPTTEQGLEALVREPTSPPEPRRYQEGGYLQRSALPLDPWGEPYQYRAPGEHNPRGFDLWSYGSDRAPGGEGDAADLGNWDS